MNVLKEFNNPQTVSKTYWSNLKTIVKDTRKQTHIKLKSNFPNAFYNQQYSTVNNKSSIPVKT